MGAAVRLAHDGHYHNSGGRPDGFGLQKGVHQFFMAFWDGRDDLYHLGQTSQLKLGAGLLEDAR